MSRTRRLVGLALSTVAVASVLFSAPAPAAVPGPPPVTWDLPWHPAVTDASGGLLAWYKPQQGLGYDQVLRLGWGFVEDGVPDAVGTSLKTYLVNSIFNPATRQGTYWQNNPSSMFGGFVDSALAWYPYSSDKRALSTVRGMLDHMLAHGLTPASWSWSGVPFPTGCAQQADYGQCLSDTTPTYYGGLEPDKVGEVGIGYVLMYEETGERAYLQEAIRCANALAAHVQPGDDTHTPWAFRLDGQTGATLNGDTFGGIVVSPLRLLDELIRIDQGDVTAYAKARRTAWGWLSSHQLNPRSPAYDEWSGYFEDVSYDPTDFNQAAPTYTALYLLNLPDPGALDPLWKAHVSHLITWVKGYLGVGPFYGAWGINEQGPMYGIDANGINYYCCSKAGLGSDSSRWAAVNALYYARTGDRQAKQNAFRSLNYATYFARSNGEVSCCGTDMGPLQYWFTDGYADYLRHFNWAMAAIPSLAPVGQSHLLGSTSVVQRVDYAHHRIAYRTFDAEGTEVLRLAFRPRSVMAGGIALRRSSSLGGAGYSLEPLGGGDVAVRVHHVTSGSVVVTG